MGKMKISKKFFRNMPFRKMEFRLEQIALILYEGGGDNTSKFSNLMKDLEKEKIEQIFGKSVMKYLFVDDAFEVYNETCNIFSLQDFLTSQQFSKDTLEAELVHVVEIALTKLKIVTVMEIGIDTIELQ